MKKVFSDARKGRMLISSPFLSDFYFRRSIVLLAEHNIEGSYGLILNKPVDTKLNDILIDFPEFDGRVYIGGPVKTDSLFYIHTVGKKIRNSEKIIDGLYWGGDFDDLKELVENENILPSEIKFFIGYAGWTPNQLEDEFKQESWIATATNKEQIMIANSSEMWHNTVVSLETKYSEWAIYPIDPKLN